jgi:hypothetical protein
MNLRLTKFASTASYDRGVDLGLYCVPSVCASHGSNSISVCATYLLYNEEDSALDVSRFGVSKELSHPSIRHGRRDDVMPYLS